MSNDVLILTIYFLVVIYVLYQMALSIESNLDDKIKVDLDRETLTDEVNRQLAQQPHLERAIATVEQLEYKGIKMPPYLALKVASPNEPKILHQLRVTVTPLGKMTRNTSLSKISVEINNMTEDAQVYIDWDKSSISTAKTKMQRVVRTGIPIGGDLSRGQIFSVVNPGTAFKADVTGEACLSLNPDDRTLEAKKSLIDMGDVIEILSDPMAGMDDFEEDLQIVAYSLRLMVGIRYITDQQKNNTAYLLLPFDFVAVLLPDEIAFPPLRWLLNRPRPENARDALTTLLLGRQSRR